MSDCVLEPGMRGIAGDGMTVRKMILLTLAGPSPTIVVSASEVGAPVAVGVLWA